MKILHYTLGLPPIRSGGLTRYASNLIEELSIDNKVIHLFPGKVDLLNKKTRIKKVNVDKHDIMHFEIINSLPLPIFGGVKEPKDFIKAISNNIYTEFLEDIKPNVIHVHTLMGLHKEFFIAAEKLNIKIIYTTHDYYGICPNISLYRYSEKKVCEKFNNGKGCLECCCTSLSTKGLLLTQTSIYPMIKKLKAYLPNKQLSSINLDEKELYKNLNYENSLDYVELRDYYFSIFKKINKFHFNSNLSKKIYCNYLPSIEGEVINITHSNINKNFIQKKYSKKIRLGYLGPYKEHKGFKLLIDTFKEISNDNYELHLFGDNIKINEHENVYTHGKYSIDELKNIFTQIDVLVVPSLWMETFGFVTLEGLSFNTPVIISNNVGSKDLVTEDYGWTFNPDQPSELKDIINSLDKLIIEQKTDNIRASLELESFSYHVNQLVNKLYLNN